MTVLNGGVYRQTSTPRKNGNKMKRKKITDKRLKWYGHVRRMIEEHIVKRMLDVDIPGNRRGRPNLRWKDACKS